MTRLPTVDELLARRSEIFDRLSDAERRAYERMKNELLDSVALRASCDFLMQSSQVGRAMVYNYIELLLHTQAPRIN